MKNCGDDKGTGNREQGTGNREQGTRNVTVSLSNCSVHRREEGTGFAVSFSRTVFGNFTFRYLCRFFSVYLLTWVFSAFLLDFCPTRSI
ncbi:hypothetical protein PN492_11055 [Dolichospermum circinale CS-537/01]|uniref:Transmembrane protein n=1 Tax=Dolichospermum circinale CS-537/01 TaxID=3021739 RepID=A0ABT5A7D1_9CYAN|nr:hypothetical protein [Dolichospermum circinale]MDB9487077.1 hypothetical protein [Dolichospermum circinale CS-537/01]